MTALRNNINPGADEPHRFASRSHDARGKNWPAQHGSGQIYGDGADPRRRSGRKHSRGHVGVLLNLWGREATAALQKVAVEESKLAIPVLFGLDVLHGHKTIFPIPLAKVGLFDLSYGRTARAAPLRLQATELP
nr:Glycoside hydrolase family 3 domain containing protein [Methylocystis sp. SC2]